MRNVLARMAVALPITFLLLVGRVCGNGVAPRHRDSIAPAPGCCCRFKTIPEHPRRENEPRSCCRPCCISADSSDWNIIQPRLAKMLCPSWTNADATCRALAWARSRGASYAVTGNVAEWRYKNGPDGEPAVGLTLQIIEIPSGAVLWSAAGSRSGWGRESVSGTAQKLLRDLLADVRVNERSP